VTRARRAVLFVAAAAATLAVSLLVAAHARQPFPHEQHTGLFPLCIGCHLGIETGNRAEYYPTPENCSTCHDGVREDVVDWRSPGPRAGNLSFEHTAHVRLIAAEGVAALACEDCHVQPGAPRMRVEPPIPEQCFACHAHQATQHFVDAACLVCHVPLAASDLPPARIAALPVPPSHERPDFLTEAHGLLATASAESCATCHAREQCTSCHVLVVAGSPIDQIPAAHGRVAVALPAATYPVPASHLDPAWERRHGQVAEPQTCGTCHTRESCTTCHATPLPPAIAALPRAAEAAAPGALVLRRAPESHASPFFDTQHGALAAARPQSCATCHDRARFCGVCHEPGAPAAWNGARAGIAVDTPRPPPAPAMAAPRAATAPRSPRGFHPPNYVLRHSAEAYGRRLECSNCHSTQLFCRDCHVSTGRGAIGRLGPGYHDAEPVWLLRHGQAARQTLESCTSCHTQRDCMQCHSQLGAFRVSPHGPNFDARRAQRVNPQICRACHLGDPFVR
jgi:hypothetical protein